MRRRQGVVAFAELARNLCTNVIAKRWDHRRRDDDKIEQHDRRLAPLRELETSACAPGAHPRAGPGPSRSRATEPGLRNGDQPFQGILRSQLDLRARFQNQMGSGNARLREVQCAGAAIG